MGRLIEDCPSCGAFNKAEIPLYIWAVGGLIVLLLMLSLGDVGAMLQVLGDMLRRLHPPAGS